MTSFRPTISIQTSKKCKIPVRKTKKTRSKVIAPKGDGAGASKTKTKTSAKAGREEGGLKKSKIPTLTRKVSKNNSSSHEKPVDVEGSTSKASTSVVKNDPKTSDGSTSRSTSSGHHGNGNHPNHETRKEPRNDKRITRTTTKEASV